MSISAKHKGVARDRAPRDVSQPADPRSKLPGFYIDFLDRGDDHNVSYSDKRDFLNDLLKGCRQDTTENKKIARWICIEGNGVGDIAAQLSVSPKQAQDKINDVVKFLTGSSAMRMARELIEAFPEVEKPEKVVEPISEPMSPEALREYIFG